MLLKRKGGRWQVGESRIQDSGREELGERIGNREQGTGSREQGTGNEEW